MDARDLLIYEGDTALIRAKNPGILGIPKGKKFFEMSTKHFVSRAKVIHSDMKTKGLSGKESVMRALLNIERWQKNKNPEISEKARTVINKLKNNKQWNALTLESDHPYHFKMHQDLKNTWDYKRFISEESLKSELIEYLKKIDEKYNVVLEDELVIVFESENTKCVFLKEYTDEYWSLIPIGINFLEAYSGEKKDWKKVMKALSSHFKPHKDIVGTKIHGDYTILFEFKNGETVRLELLRDFSEVDFVKGLSADGPYLEEFQRFIKGLKSRVFKDMALKFMNKRFAIKNNFKVDIEV